MDSIRVSSEIDAYCTKCRMVTNHRVVAMMNGVVKRVICLTCQGQHNFRTPPGQKGTSHLKAKRVRKEEKRATGSKSLQHWLDLKAALSPEVTPRLYNMKEEYREGEVLEHPRFGLGFVNRVLSPTKMSVLFEFQLKTLVMNY